MKHNIMPRMPKQPEENLSMDFSLHVRAFIISYYETQSRLENCVKKLCYLKLFMLTNAEWLNSYDYIVLSLYTLILSNELSQSRSR